MLCPLLVATASSYGFLSRGMGFGPYDNDLALRGLSNELPYVSPDPFVVSTSNNSCMDSSVCSDPFVVSARFYKLLAFLVMAQDDVRNRHTMEVRE